MKQKHDFYEAYKRRRELEEENTRLKRILMAIDSESCNCARLPDDNGPLCCFCIAAQGVYNVRR